MGISRSTGLCRPCPAERDNGYGWRRKSVPGFESVSLAALVEEGLRRSEFGFTFEIQLRAGKPTFKGARSPGGLYYALDRVRDRLLEP